jgi:hypothetical protein
MSWFNVTPHLDDPETWNESTLDTLRKSGYVVNLCQSEIPFTEKPRLFFYGNMGAQFEVRTVHLYTVPLPMAYSALDMTIKGCIRNWAGVKSLVENCPRTPPKEEVTWSNQFGPQSFQELVSKTYVGAAIIDTTLKEPLKYFTDSDEWHLIEIRGKAAAFVRRSSH